jgi:exonuclease III
VFHYTNYVFNVGNYIIPAEKEGLIKQTIQVRNTQNLEDYLDLRSTLDENIILNLDLDFFQPDLDFIDYDLKKKVVLDAAEKAKVITVATSPFFIDQKLALKVFNDIFGE